MDITTLRRTRPEYANLDDETIVKALSLQYPNVPVDQIASDLGVKVAAPPTPSRTIGGTLGDLAISGLKGAISVPESAVGLADMATGGRVGQALDGIGFRPEDASNYLDTLYSDPQKAAFQKVQDATGFVDTAKAAIENPSTIVQGVVQSLPAMGAGGVVGRGILGVGARVMGSEAAAAGSMGPYAVPGVLARAAGSMESAGGIAGAIGEGVTMAGQDAEQIRASNPDGSLSPEQSRLALGIGAEGAGFAMLGAKVAKSLGIHDPDTLLAAGNVNETARKGLVRRVLEGAVSEGVLEELPQSVVEQVMQNMAMNRPLDEGVDNQAVMGLLSGGLMGAGANAHEFHHDATGLTKAPPMADAAAGPISQAAVTSQAATGTAVPVADPQKLHDAVQALVADEAKTREKPQDAVDRQVAQQQRVVDQQQAQDDDPFTRPIPYAAKPPVNAAPANAAPQEEDPFTRPIPGPQDSATITPGTVDEGAHEAAASPTNDKSATPAQILGGNAQLGHTQVGGLDVSIENPAGSTRSDLKNTPPKWSTDMKDHYGYFLGTTGADGDHVDTYIRKGTPTDYAGPVYVVDQIHQDGGNAFDEHKVMLGYANRGAAVNAYKGHYTPGWKMGRVTEMPMDQFKDWLKNGDTSKPASPSGPMAPTQGKVNAASTQQEAAAPAPAVGATQQPAADAAAAPAAAAVEAAGLNNQESPDASAKPAPEAQPASGEPARADGANLPDARPGPVAGVASTDAQAGENGTAPAAAAPLASPAGERVDEPTSARWTRMTAADREALLATRTAAKKPAMIATRAWDELAPNWHKAIERALKEHDAAAPVKTADTEKVHRNMSDAEDALRTAGKDTHEIVRVPKGLVVREKTNTTQPGQSEQSGEQGKGEKPAAGDREAPSGLRRGTVGMKLAAGERVLTASGRETQPFPKVDTSTNGKTNNTVLRANRWLLAEAMTEAHSRGDTFNERQFHAVNNLNPSQADKDSAEEYLFGEQPPVVPSILKPLSAKAPAPGQHQAPIQTAINAVTEFRNGQIDKPALIDRLRALNLQEGEVASVTYRLGDDFTAADIRAVLEKAAGTEAKATAAPGAAPAPAPIATRAPAAAKPQVSANTIFTDDAAEKARAVLRAKLASLNSGIDPELMQAGITLAGWHIEKGARTFAAFAKSMLADLGDGIRPYLKSWYMAVRYDPRSTAFTHEMSSPGLVDEFNVADIEAPTDTRSADNSATTTETPDADLAQTERVPGERAGGNQPDAAAGDGHRESLDAGVAGSSEGADRAGAVSAGTGEADGRGNTDVRTTGEPASGTPRDSGNVRADTGAADADARDAKLDPATAPSSDKPALDFNLQGEDIGKGGLTAKYRDNIAAIRVLKALEAESRTATPDERRAVARYVGWGALKGVFDQHNKGWAKQHEELKGLLTPEEWKAARASTLNAHYTSKDVVGGMYNALARMGFTSGRVLEPSVGVGNFFGLMPAAMRKASQLHGVELDPLTSKIAAALYPSAKVTNGGFQDFQVPGEFFDMAIGNPPFGSEPLSDMERSPYSGMSIHNYFFAKSIDKLRPGGLLAMVVSHSFLDAQNTATRQWIGQRARLVSAVRLPNTAFKENAGTEVVTDIIVLQKLAPGEKGNGAEWVDTAKQANVNPKTGETAQHNVSTYFDANPQNVLGTPSAGGTMYGANEYTVAPKGDLSEGLAQWVKGLPENIFEPIDRTADMQRAEVDVPEHVKVGSFYTDDKGLVHQRTQDSMGAKTAQQWMPPNAKAKERMVGMIGLRDALRQQMVMERSTTATEAEIEAGRAKLNELYEGFRKNYGYLNDATNRRVFSDDTDAPLVQMLEFNYDKGVSATVAAKEDIPPRAPVADKSDILKRRVLFPPQENIQATSAKDALLASLNFKGAIDLPYMQQVYGKDAEAIVKELGDVVYQDPVAGLTTTDAYLSGDVKTKLAEAKAAALADPSYQRNVKALEKVIPADKMPSEIHAAPGSAFLPPDVIDGFAKHVTGAGAVAQYIRATGQWLVNFKDGHDRVKNTSQWGTARMPAADILTRTMLGQSVVVKDTHRNADGSTTTTVNEKETEAARAKQQAMKEEWQHWLWSDAARAERIAGIYNDKMNRWVDRAYDGSHLTFPGMSPAYALLQHQQNGVWRGLQSRQLLLDHVVGAGKTFQMAAMAMEMRRMGVARKPLFAVPNHLTLQWRDEFARLYPGSKVLAATPEDFAKGAREKFFSKIVTGDWDAVIVGHSSLKKVSLPAHTERAVLEEQVQELSDAIEQMKRERGDRNILRDMERIRARLESKMTDKLAALGKRDKVLTLDELGLDAMFVDELHEFKNLFYNSTMERNAGMGNPTGSDKAFDLFVKIRWLTDTFGEKAPLITATGTPVSNSLVEMFNMQRLMQYPRLKAEGLHVFDGWANQFGSVESLYEVSPSGTGYRTSSRFAKFKNLPALMAHYKSFADVVTLDDLKAQEEAQGKRFPVPKLKTGRPMLVVADRSPQVAEFMGVPHLAHDDEGNVRFGVNLGRGESVEVVDAGNNAGWDAFRVVEGSDGESTRSLIGRFPTQEQARLAVVQKALTPDIQVDPNSILGQFANLRDLTRQTKGKVNALSLTGQANKAGLDYRLIDPTAPDFPGSKINKAVTNMLTTYKEWAGRKGAQIVFCDLSIPLSSRAALGSKETRLYVRDEGQLTHKRGTMHTVPGYEELPFFVVGAKNGTSSTFSVHDAASGLRLSSGHESKAAAKVSTEAALRDESKRGRWIEAREQAGDITQEEVDDYNNEHEIDTEETQAITPQDIAGMSQATGFSVYDDIKAKLMKGGVPEREIAFIHDYDTPTAKAKLFSAVKSGEVRFLLGSTPKLGAGTNVQNKLVGLHHIDAPWRPSDLEQREGRIIRRGNEFYEANPEGFEVGIWRYATAQTYDTRRWQLLEHKARVIEQLRNYDGSANEIEDVAGEAASAADMKAAASGDPLILEETKLRNEVKRLQNLQAAHADKITMLQRQARSSADYAERAGPKDQAELERMRDAAAKNPANKDGFAPLLVNGQEQSDKDSAIAAIQRAIARTLAGIGSSTFRYRGLDFGFANSHGDTFVLHSPSNGAMDYFKQSEAISPSGLLTRFGNYVDRIPAHIEDVKQRIVQSRKDAEGMLAESKKSFAEAPLLAQTRDQFRAVQRKLIAKGPDVQDSEKPVLVRALAEQRESLRAAGYGDALQEFMASTQVPEDISDRPSANIAQMGDPIANTSDVVFSQNAFRQGDAAPGAATPEKVARLQQFVDDLGEKWAKKPDVVVVPSVASLATPAAIRAEARKLMENGGNVPSGVFHVDPKSGPTVYLFADRITSSAKAAEVLLHEIKGHYGLRGNFGAELDGILRQIAQARPAQVEAMMRKNGFQSTERLRAAEEILAEMAQKQPELGFVRRAVAAIRTFLRDTLGLPLKLSDDEIVRSYLAPAARFVDTGQRDSAAPGAATPAFSQSEGRGLRTVQVDGVRRPDSNSQGQPIVPPTQGMQGAVNFWRWFGDSKVLDGNGRPLVVYHGTNADFSAFDPERTGKASDAGYLGTGSYFAQRPDQASSYGAAVYPTYLSLKNPYQWKDYSANAFSASGFSDTRLPFHDEVLRAAGVTQADVDALTIDKGGRLSSDPGVKEAREAMMRKLGDAVRKVLESKGYDGIAAVNERADGNHFPEYVAFRPEQVKSAIGNNGQFDAGTDNILFSQPEEQAYAGTNDPRQFLGRGMDFVREYSNTPGKLNWWHKSMGTMYNLAERNPVFKQVFDRVQTYIADISHYATEAADLAPRILPKLDGARDLLPKWLGGTKEPLAVADKKAIQTPIWDGTLRYTRDQDGRPIAVGDLESRYENLDVHERGKMLMSRGVVSESDLKRWQNLPIASFEGAVNSRFERAFLTPGIRWSDAELRERYGLSDKQLSLYQEARTSVDRSVTRLAQSNMVKLGGDDLAPIADQLMEADSPMAAAEVARDYLTSLADDIPERADSLRDAANKIVDMGQKGKDLLARGYAPLMRFGHYTVDVVDRESGERKYFGLYESRMAARAAAEQLAREFPTAAIQRGTTSDEAYKQFAGVSVDTMELLGEMMGLETDGDGPAHEAFQEWLRITKSNRSALRRLIERKGIAGFNEDITRVLAGFITSNARQTSGNLHTKDIGAAVSGIDKKDGELKDSAYRLMNYVLNPQQEAPAIKSLLFAQYLGGSVASALVNMTQPIQVTMPYLAQYGGVRQAARQMAGALKTAWSASTGNEELDRALKRAEEDGVVAPQEIHQLMAYGRGAGALKAGDGTFKGNVAASASNAASRIVHGWGQLFSAAELFNRRVAYVAAWNTAKAQGIKDADTFARKAVDATQFVYTKANRPEWARGALGGTLFTFKQYSISYLELLHRMYTQGGPEGKKAALFSLAMIVLMAGAGGLPFMEDAENAIDGIAFRLFGINLSTKAARQAFLKRMFGEAAGGFLEHGVSNGLPLDVSGRMGLQHLIPGSGLLTPKKDHTSDVVEFAGPVGDLAQRGYQAAGQLAQGKPVDAALTMAPQSLRNLDKARDMYTSGMYKDQGGKRVIDTDGWDALIKAVGFQPADVATAQQGMRAVQQSVSETRLRESEIADEWARRQFEKDPGAAQWAREQINDWNKANPESPMRIQYAQITRRLREMNKSKAERLAQSAPKEMRAEVRRQLAGPRE